MSVRVCYVQRSSGGDTITGVRLVGERSDESWSAPSVSPDAPGPLDADAAADWIQSRLARAAGRAIVDLICLDADGSACAWVSAPSADAEVVTALTRQGGSSGDHDGPSRSGSPLAAYCASPDEASVALLGDPAPPRQASASLKSRLGMKPKDPADNGTPQHLRLPVMAVTDICARLLMDALDQRRVSVGGVTSVWHAMVAAFDHARPAADSAAVPQLTAVVLVDTAGRLLWSWSRAGVIVAGGSMRLAVERPPVPEAGGELAVRPGGTWTGRNIHEPRPVPIFGAAEASRLSAEWLAWAAQLGRAPSRIIGVTPPPEQGNATSGPGPFGEALGRAWPGAGVDLATADDPLGNTLSRLAEHIDDSRGASAPAGPPPVTVLENLSYRPTGAHRSLLIWSALAMIGLASAVGVAAYRLRVQAGETRAEAARYADRWKGMVGTVNPKFLERSDHAVTDMDKLIADMEKAAKPKTSGLVLMPVREELATLSMVLGDPLITLQEIDVATAQVTITIVGATEAAAELRHALSEIAGSHIASWEDSASFNVSSRGGAAPARASRLIGKWDRAAEVRLEAGPKEQGGKP